MAALLLRVGVFLCIMMAASVSASESLSIHFQPVAHNMDNNIIQIGVAYAGLCNKLQVQAFMEQDVLNNTFNHMVGSFSTNVSRNTSFSIVTVPDGIFANNDTVIRIVAMNGSEICSDMESQQSFYCFFPDRFIEYRTRNESVAVSIPTSRRCDYPLAIWPKGHTKNRRCIYCYCFPIEIDDYSFDTCAEQCQSEFSPSLSEGSITFNTSSLEANESFFVHFVCDLNPCYIKSSFCGTKYIEMSYSINMMADGQESSKGTINKSTSSVIFLPLILFVAWHGAM